MITLLGANDRPIPQVIAYEPVMQPFGRHALPDLKKQRRPQTGIAPSRSSIGGSPAFPLRMSRISGPISTVGRWCAA
ncbi:hypothetical protein [Streptomyces sp. NPDC001537]